MAEEAALWEVYLPVIPLSIFNIIPPNLHIHSSLIDAARSKSLTNTPLAHQRVCSFVAFIRNTEIRAANRYKVSKKTSTAESIFQFAFRFICCHLSVNLSAWSRELLEKFVVDHLGIKLPTFHGSQMVMFSCSTTRQFSLV